MNASHIVDPAEMVFPPALERFGVFEIFRWMNFDAATHRIDGDEYTQAPETYSSQFYPPMTLEND